MNTDKNRIHEEELQDDSSNSTVEGKLFHSGWKMYSWQFDYKFLLFLVNEKRDLENDGPPINPNLPFPKSIFLIVGNEFCERFSYYGMRSKSKVTKIDCIFVTVFIL